MHEQKNLKTSHDHFSSIHLNHVHPMFQMQLSAILPAPRNGSNGHLSVVKNKPNK
jgi:hypothetical protein